MIQSSRLGLSFAACLALVSGSVTSFAQDATQPAPQQPAQQPAQPAPQQQQPQQSQPVQSVNVQTPQAQPQQPVGTATTTAAPYGANADTTEQTTEKRPNRALLSTGVGMFVLSYVPSLVAGAISDRDADKNLFIPVAGPWIDLGNRGCDDRPCGGREDVNKAMIITSGVVQGLGVLVGLSSLIIPESTSTTTKRTVGKGEVRVLPVSFGTGGGLGAVGTF